MMMMMMMMMMMTEAKREVEEGLAAVGVELEDLEGVAAFEGISLNDEASCQKFLKALSK